jgi:predicted transcriptional regulator
MFTGAKQRMVDTILEHFKRKPQSILTLNAITGIAISTLSGRVSELCDMGILKESAKQPKAQKFTEFVYVSDSAEQKQLAYLREEEKYQFWLKKGKEMGWFERVDR